MATEDARKLFVAGLPESISEDVLRQLFEATGGTVVDVSLPRDRATGRPRGFGFVTAVKGRQASFAMDGESEKIKVRKLALTGQFRRNFLIEQADGVRPKLIAGSGTKTLENESCKLG